MQLKTVKVKMDYKCPSCGKIWDSSEVDYLSTKGDGRKELVSRVHCDPCFEEYLNEVSGDVHRDNVEAG